VLQDQGSKGKSPTHDLSPRSTPAESEVNPTWRVDSCIARVI